MPPRLAATTALLCQTRPSCGRPSRPRRTPGRDPTRIHVPACRPRLASTRVTTLTRARNRYPPALTTAVQPTENGRRYSAIFARISTRCRPADVLAAAHRIGDLEQVFCRSWSGRCPAVDGNAEHNTSAVVLIQDDGRHSPSIYRRYGRLIAHAMRDVQQPCNPEPASRRPQATVTSTPDRDGTPQPRAPLCRRPRGAGGNWSCTFVARDRFRLSASPTRDARERWSCQCSGGSGSVCL